MTSALTRKTAAGVALLAIIAGGSALTRNPVHAHATTLPLVTVTMVYPDNSTAKIEYNPFPGAKDYRILDVSNPTKVKYAGMRHLDAGVFYHFVMEPNGVTPVFPYTSTNDNHGTGPQTLDVPNTEINWNILDDGLPHTLVVQALDGLGPVPPNNLANNYNNPLYPPASFLGSNTGSTPDGNDSINGQGSFTATEHVIAQSQPFVVQANKAYLPLPSRSNAVQTFLDTFDNSEAGNFQQIGTADPMSGVMTYTLNAGTSRAWDVVYQGADTDHSTPFIMDGHFMDVLFDGMTPSAIPPTWHIYPHAQYTNMSLSPQVPADLSGGKLLHLTMEVDSNLFDFHRWLAWQLAPANDPITYFRADDNVTGGASGTPNSTAINKSDHALWVQLLPQVCDAMLFEGPKSPTNAAPKANGFLPAHASPGPAPCFHTNNWGGRGIGFDDRERWDLFVTTKHMAVFEDGQMLIEKDIPDGGLPFTQAKVYFTHYMYSTATQYEAAYLKQNAPWATYWLNYYPHSDERHWDNMGFEVLPASDVPSGSWSSLSSLLQMPAGAPPHFK